MDEAPRHGARADTRRVLAADLGDDPGRGRGRLLRRAADQGGRPHGALRREPDADDPIIAELGDPSWSAWMHDNFFRPEPRRQSSGDARSYASRLFDYGGAGRDQLAWVVERLRERPRLARRRRSRRSSRSTTRATSPASSMLDFWAPDGALELVVYAHSLDFGKKALRQPRRARRGLQAAGRERARPARRTG